MPWYLSEICFCVRLGISIDLVIKESYHRVPGSEEQEEEGERHVDEEPAMQPMMQASLQIEHPSLVAPAPNLALPKLQ